jgi:hypothetical protein
MTINFKLIPKAFLFLALAATIYITNGCSNDTTASSDQSTMTTSTTMEGGAVSSMYDGKTPKIDAGGLTADSVVITRARIVIRTLKLHQIGDADDTIPHQEHDEDKGEIKAGPFIAEFDATGAKIVSTVTIPPGTYDRVKFEIHKLNETEDPSLLNNSLYGDFVNGGRYTFIIEGFSWVNGVAYPFTFKSSRTENVQVFFDTAIVFSAGKSYDLALNFSPKLMFGRVGLRPLDPREVDNQKEIEKLIHFAIKALRTPH